MNQYTRCGHEKRIQWNSMGQFLTLESEATKNRLKFDLKSIKSKSVDLHVW